LVFSLYVNIFGEPTENASMPTYGSADHFIEPAIQAQRQAETIHMVLAKKCAHHPDMAAFWAMYAEEEPGDEHWLENLRRRIPPECLEVQAANPTQISEASPR
jgi:hypothetical protein